MASAESLTVVSYNVENLFHPSNDSITADEEWTPEGERHWSFTRYNRKVENIARVLTNIGEWEGVDIVGLQEIENAAVVKKLCYTLRPGEYDMVHYDSPDPRGIDVALIYKKSRVDTLSCRVIRIQHSELRTRDILYVCARIDKRDTVHFFVCHFPSQRGGAAESAWKREVAKETLQEAVDSIYAIHPNAKIIVMGDMNSEDIRMSGLTDKKMKGNGTHKYQGQWSFLDHFYVSPSINEVSTARVYDAQWIQESDEKFLGIKPQRTYNGFTYQNGFSDHLPIVLTVSF
ncbi:MAG: hypothetical protein IKQ11_00420 [Paludibacteraceae bacterium]|nr:hypothetical protein [Paludibacteraceae bacterium]